MDEAKQVKDLLDELYNRVLKSDENGLFQNDQTGALQKIQGEIFAGLSALEVRECDNEEKEVLTARKHYFNAYHELSSVVRSKDRLWRFGNVYALPIFGYLIAAYFIDLLLALYLPSGTLLGVNIQVFLLGALGGITQGMWYLWQNVSKGEYRKAWIPWAMLTPLLGTSFGLIVYLIYAGFVSAASSASFSTVIGGPGPFVVTFLGGFFWRKTTELMQKFFDSIFSGAR